MAGFFKRFKEHQELSKTLNGLYLFVCELQHNLNTGNFEEIEEIEENLMIAAYIAKKGVVDRTNQYGFMGTTVVVPAMNGAKKIQLETAMLLTVGTIWSIAESMNFEVELDSIFEKKELYYEIESIIQSSGLANRMKI